MKVGKTDLSIFFTTGSIFFDLCYNQWQVEKKILFFFFKFQKWNTWLAYMKASGFVAASTFSKKSYELPQSDSWIMGAFVQPLNSTHCCFMQEKTTRVKHVLKTLTYTIVNRNEASSLEQ